MAEEAQVRRQERQDRDELRSTYQQSFWYYITEGVHEEQGRVKVVNEARDLPGLY